MINEWRKLWSTNTPTSDKFPFGFMQLSTWDANQNTGFPAIRWHQTADRGYVPNEVMEVSNHETLSFTKPSSKEHWSTTYVYHAFLLTECVYGSCN